MKHSSVLFPLEEYGFKSVLNLPFVENNKKKSSLEKQWNSISNKSTHPAIFSLSGIIIFWMRFSLLVICIFLTFNHLIINLS